MKQKVESILQTAKKSMAVAKSQSDLYDLKVLYLGKKGQLSVLMKGLKDFPAKERPQWGQFFNQARKQLEDLYNQKKQELSHKEISEKINKEQLDLSLPGPLLNLGSKHPVFCHHPTYCRLV